MILNMKEKARINGRRGINKGRTVHFETLNLGEIHLIMRERAGVSIRTTAKELWLSPAAIDKWERQNSGRIKRGLKLFKDQFTQEELDHVREIHGIQL